MTIGIKKSSIAMLVCILIILSASYSFGGTNFTARCLSTRYSTMSTECIDSENGYFDVGCSNWEGRMDDTYAISTKSYFLQGKKMCDDGKQSWCEDDESGNLDNGDAVAFFCHGAWDGGEYMVGLSSSIDNGGDGCLGRSDNWWIGNDMVEFVSTYACYSNQMTKGYYVRTFGRGMHQWHGMHGIGDMPQRDWADDFADDAFDGPISSAWITNMTDFDYWQLTTYYYDLCGVSATFGEDIDDCNTRRRNENYNNPHYYSDPPYSSEVLVYHYYCDCHPLWPASTDPTPSC